MCEVRYDESRTIFRLFKRGNDDCTHNFNEWKNTEVNYSCPLQYVFERVCSICGRNEEMVKYGVSPTMSIEEAELKYVNFWIN